MRELEKVFVRLKGSRPNIKTYEVQIFKRKIAFLGHVFDADD